nr:hypothetical protein [Saprospiraceae bacterium]
MKKFYHLSLMMVLLLISTFATAQCAFTVQMYDSFGDGWNGNTLNVSVNGGAPTPFTIASATGTQETGVFMAAEGATITMTWTDGLYTGETEFGIFDPQGNLIFMSLNPNPTNAAGTTTNINGINNVGATAQNSFTVPTGACAAPLTPCAAGTGTGIGGYAFSLTDSFGDGWDNAYAVVNNGGYSSLMTIFNVDGSPVPNVTNYNFTVPLGSTLSATYTAGSYEGEHEYSFSGPSGASASGGAGAANITAGAQDLNGAAAGTDITAPASCPLPGCALAGCPADQAFSLGSGECTAPDVPFTLTLSGDDCVVEATPIPGFAGPYAPAAASSQQQMTCGTSAATATTVTLETTDIVSGGNTCTFFATQISWTVAQTGTITFDWNYNTLDIDGPTFDPFGYAINFPTPYTLANLLGNVVQLSSDSGADAQTGSATINVTAGQTFTLVSYTTDGTGGQSTTVVSNFAFTPLPASPSATLSVNGAVSPLTVTGGTTITGVVTAPPIGVTDVVITVTAGDGSIISCDFSITVDGVTAAEATDALVCNDHVNVSLAADCTHTLGAGDVLEGGPFFCFDDYIVGVDRFGGGIFGSPNLTGSDIGHTYQYQVIDPTTGNRCWGTILVEDKIAPVIDCSNGCTATTSTIQGNSATSALTCSSLGNSCLAFDGFTPTTGSHAYAITPFTVTTAGNYTFDMVSTDISDGLAMIYNSSGFDCASPCTNLVGGDDDGPSGVGVNPQIANIALAVGDYFLVTTSWGTTGSGAFTWNVTGPADLTLNNAPCEITCQEVPAVLAAATGTGAALLPLGITYPEIVSGVCGTPTWSVSAVNNTTNCGGSITLTYVLTEPSGMTATCTKLINVVPLTLADVDFPADTVHIGCGGGTTPTQVDAHNNPSTVTVGEGFPEVNGQNITTGGICNLFATKVDVPVDEVCGANSHANKIIRRWTVVDWCTGQSQDFLQLLSLKDEVAPAVTQGTVTMQPDYFRCGQRVTICRPNVTDECTINPSLLATSYSITTSLNECVNASTIASQYPSLSATLSGNFNSTINIGTPTSDRYYNAATRCWTLSLPAGDHSITYTAIDPCNNEGSVTVALPIADAVDPNPVSPEFLQTTLNPWDCQSDVYAASFNQGSWDNCGIIRYEVRRQRRNATTGAPSFNSAGQPIMENWASASATAPAANREYVHVDGLD